jgi:hypothetical protein
MIVTSIPMLDELLDAHAGALAGDATAYRNHAYRVANFCYALGPSTRAQLDKIAIAAACHDLRIWTDLLDTYTQKRLPIGAAVLEWSRAQVATLQPNLCGTAIGRLIEGPRQTNDGRAPSSHVSGVCLSATTSAMPIRSSA